MVILYNSYIILRLLYALHCCSLFFFNCSDLMLSYLIPWYFYNRHLRSYSQKASQTSSSTVPIWWGLILTTLMYTTLMSTSTVLLLLKPYVTSIKSKVLKSSVTMTIIILKCLESYFDLRNQSLFQYSYPHYPQQYVATCFLKSGSRRFSVNKLLVLDLPLLYLILRTPSYLSSL